MTMSRLQKRCTDDTVASRPNNSSKGDLLAQKIGEVDEIASQLSDKHSQSFTVEQIRAWAHLIQIKKHESYDYPPDKPFFRNKSVKKKEPASCSSSPGKRIQLRSECMDQLQKWHDLKTKGVITHEQYDQLQAKIMNDIGQL